MLVGSGGNQGIRELRSRGMISTTYRLNEFVTVHGISLSDVPEAFKRGKTFMAEVVILDGREGGRKEESRKKKKSREAGRADR